MGKVTADLFVEAFREVWEERLKNEEEHIKSIYPDGKVWTKFMLDENGVIDSVRKKFGETNLYYKTEWYTIDALFVSGVNTYKDGLSYPSELHVLIEHEQGDDIEIEMWKLIHWRSPLKVIFFYDWNDDDKSNDKKKKWKNEKIEKLISMLTDVNKFHKENFTTEYLFIIGSRKDKNSVPKWEYVVDGCCQ